MVRPNDLITFIDDGQFNGITAVWVTISGSRSEFTAEISTISNGRPIITWEVQSTQFVNGDSVSDDAMNVLVNRQNEIESISDLVEASGCLVIVLVSKRKLGIAQTSSPCHCPEWVPKFGGRLEHVHIRDVTHSILVSLNNFPDVSSQISVGLIFLEQAIHDRLRFTLTNSPSSLESFAKRVVDALKIKSNGTGHPLPTFAEFIDRASGHAARISSPTEFRLDAGPRTKFILGAVVTCWQRCTFDELNRFGKELTTALGLTRTPTAECFETLSSVMMRPHDFTTLEMSTRFGRSLIINTAFAYQLLTAEHHAAEYPRIEAARLESQLREISQVIRKFGELLDQPRL
jgi:hypothetical protein